MKLFVGKTCIPCKELKKWLSEKNIEIEQIVADDNMEEAIKAGVKVLPSLILDDSSVISGKDNIKDFFEKE